MRLCLITGKKMNAEKLIYDNAKNTVLRLGYDDEQSSSVADHILTMYKRNQLKKATDFIDEAKKHAIKQFGKIKKKSKI